MTDEPTPPPFELPDVRVLTITLSPPMWVPVIAYEDDLDDLAALGLLRLATRMQEEQLLEACMIDEEDDDGEI